MSLRLPKVRTLRTRLVVILLPVVAVGVIAMTVLAVKLSTDAARDSAKRELLEQARQEANAFNSGAAEAAALSKTLDAQMERNPNLTREQVDSLVKGIAVANPRIAGSYVTFERDAFDGLDAQYAGKPGQTPKGELSPYWNRLSGKLQNDPTPLDQDATYYAGPRDAGKLVVVEPYIWEGYPMVSYNTPITVNGKFRGIAGIDVVLKQLATETAKVKAYDTGYAFVVSNSGTFLTAPEKGLITKQTLAGLGKKQDNAELASIQQDVRSGTAGTVETTDPFTGKDAIVAYAPVATGNWGFLISAPTDEVLADAHRLRNLLLIAGGVLLLIVALAITGVAARITKPLKGFVTSLRSLAQHDVADLRDGMTAMAEGDLTKTIETTTEPVPITSADEIGQASETMNELIDSTRDSVAAYERSRGELSSLLGGVTASADRVTAASRDMASTSEETGRAVGEIANAVGEVASGAERQVRMVESARELTESVGDRVRDSAQQAQETAAAADRAREIALAGVDGADEAVDVMRTVRDSSAGVRDTMQGLAGRSEQIGGIVATITAIADQTNLLALNAAIEAARAGEQGRGFAVVADEVRQLAEESQTAAASISTLIGEIQSETERAVHAVEEGAQRGETAMEIAASTRQRYSDIGEVVDEVNARVAAIAAQVQQVADEAARVQHEMSEVASVAEESSAASQQVSASTEQTSAATQQVAASAQELADTAAALDRLVKGFQL